MLVYLLMMLVIFGVRYYIMLESEENPEIPKNIDILNKRWLTFAWLTLSLVQGLRAYSVGTDTVTYVSYFRNGSRGQFEAGYELLNSVLGWVTKNPTILLIAVALLINGLVLHAIYKMSHAVEVSLFAYISLYYYFNSFNGMRQYIAIAFVVTAYACLHENKPFRAVAWMLVAMQFHKSSFIGFLLFPNYFILHRKMPSMRYARGTAQVIELSEPLRRVIRAIMFVFVLIVFSVGFDTAIRLVINFLPQYNGYFYTDYAKGTGAIQQKIVYAAILLAYMLLSEDDEWMLVMCYAVCIALLMSKIRMMSRFLWYFDIFSIFAIADIWKTRITDAGTTRYIRIAIGVICLAFMIYYLKSGVMRVTPYRFVFMGR